MGSALLWGGVAASSLVVGALLGLARKWPDRWVGVVLAFGAGALVSSVSFELAEEGLKVGSGLSVGIGLAVGAFTYWGLNREIDRRSSGSGAGTALALGAFLDGIPEQLVLGIGIATGGGVSVALLVAIFVSNLPEAIGSASQMREAKRPPSTIRRLWIAVAVVCLLATLAGYGIADNVSGEFQAAVDGFAAGALLVMLVDSMIPEAARKAGDIAGLVTTLGFAVAFGLSAVLMILPTSLVGSYPQPDWLIDREKLAARFPPRVRALELWRVDPRYLEEAQDDATLLAIRDQERAGLDIVTDGEQRRESYSNRFANALTGIDLDNPGSALDRSGHPNPVPRVVGPIQRKHPVQVGDLEFLKANTDRKVKITVPGPFTMSQQAQNDHYEHDAELGQAYAAAVNEEIADLFAAGADVVQIDEPYMQARPEKAREYGVAALERALDGHTGTTAVHICFGYAAIIHERPSGYSFLTELAGVGCDQISIETAQSGLDCSVLAGLPGKTIILGVIDLDDVAVETPDTVAERIRRALPYKGAGELVAAPDCGMKYLPREAAFGKLQSLAEGARLVRG